jgi:hypothetical protein
MASDFRFGSNASVQLSRHVGFTPDSGLIDARQRTDASGHVWRVPAVQEESYLSAKRSGAAMYAACFSRRGLPRRDAAAVAAGPDASAASFLLRLT